MFIELQMSADDEAEVLMYGPIGSSLFQEGITAQDVAAALAKVPSVKRIKVRLNSPGGSVWEGMAIRAQLAEHPARVTAHIEGLAASCASVIAMGADEIVMHAGSRMMVHEAHRYTQGDVREHEKAIGVMQGINASAAEIYAARTGRPLSEVKDMMAAETWLTPDEAVAKGFADKAVAAKSGGSIAAPQMSVDLSPYGYRHVPPQLAAALEQARSGGDKSAPNREKRMSFARIAMALGMSGEGADEAAVMAAVDRQNKQIQRGEQLMAELRHITGQTSAEEVLGAVRGYAQSHTQLSATRGELDTLKLQLETSEREQLIAADAANPKGRKLTPAVAKLFADKPVKELKAYLEVAHVIPGTATGAGASTSGATGAGGQPPVQGGGGQQGAAGGGVDVLTHEGKSWEQLKPYEQHNLYVDDRAAFYALKQNFEQRTQRV